jgi:membrane-bound lytic murein transglycosylase F
MIRGRISPRVTLFPVLLSLLLLSACEEIAPTAERDFDLIAEGDTLVLLTTFNSTSYFIYRGEPMGYEYELARAFAEEHDLHLRVEVVRERERVFDQLRAGEGDLAGARLLPALEGERDVAFSSALYETEPVLVQRTDEPEEMELPGVADTIIEMGDPEAAPSAADLRVRRVSRPEQLGDQTVHLARASDYRPVLIELSDEITGDIEVVEIDTVRADEAVIRQIATGDVDFTVTQEELAELKEEYFDNVTVRPVVGPTHSVAFAVRENAPILLRELNSWLEANADLRQALYQKYFIDRAGYRQRVESEYLTSETGRLSDYDDLLRRYSREIGWDWRLLASLAFQESRFDRNARSWAGAQGLLQLMPATAAEHGVTNLTDPEQNVIGGTRFLAWLMNYWEDEIEDEDERRKFILASYNTGAGHVGDARRLAEAHGDNPDVWEDVAFWLLKKSERRYYTHPVVQFGFSRGYEPVAYVRVILDRYDHYQEFVVDDLVQEEVAG